MLGVLGLAAGRCGLQRRILRVSARGLSPPFSLQPEALFWINPQPFFELIVKLLAQSDEVPKTIARQLNLYRIAEDAPILTVLNPVST